MTTEDIYLKLKSISNLPSPSMVALEVMRLCYSKSSSLQDITKVVETDPSLSAEFLKFANSALFASVVPVSSVQRAAVKIGMKGMVNLALSFSLIAEKHDSTCEGFSYNKYWSKSLAQAVTARAIGGKQKQFDPDELFTCALLSHIGELAFATAFPQEYSKILSQELTGFNLLEAESNAFGLNHHELTAEMFQDWGLPKKYCLAAKFHEHQLPDHIHDNDVVKLVELMHLALQIADICMLELPLSKTFSEIEEIAEEFGIPNGYFNEFFDQIVRTWQEWGYLYNIQTEQCPLYHQIKKVEEISIESQVKSTTDEVIQILAVDDDPLTLLNLSRILKNDKRRVITAEDGQEAIQIAQDLQPEMVITDWHMPHLNGLELCQALRNTSSTQHTYIIMLTSNEADDELVQAFDAGADDYVVKPFRPKVLEARIRSGERLIRYQRKVNHDREVIQKYASRLSSANRKLRTMAMTDALTSLPNRRSAMSRMKDAVAESKRYNEQLSCILIDIDHFKQINDTYGHDNGDIVLIEIAQIFAQNARSYDMVSRMGGEEFLVISTRSDRSDTLLLAERLRSAVEQHTVTLSDGNTATVTISLGVATWSNGYIDGDDLIKAADNALYQAKHNGRNRIETAWSSD
jgi:diguanylate cyclase (GGDEF)-like protein